MQVINPTTSLFNQVSKMIEEAIRILPHSIVVRVVKVKKNTVDVSNIDLKPSVQTLIKNVPIIRSIYNRYPIKIGDVGVCLTVDYSVEPLLKNSKLLKKSLQKSASGSGYLFFPFASSDNDFATDTMANEMYSLDGKTQFIIDNLKVELKDRFNNDIVINNSGITITDANKNEIVINSSGITIKNSSCKIELGASGVNINNGALEIMP